MTEGLKLRASDSGALSLSLCESVEPHAEHVDTANVLILSAGWDGAQNWRGWDRGTNARFTSDELELGLWKAPRRIRLWDTLTGTVGPNRTVPSSGTVRERS